ncbi:MAG: phosphotransferase [Thalassotalea sp.]|nr:phosphotransferase [Thalassotalea sp.]
MGKLISTNHSDLSATILSLDFFQEKNIKVEPLTGGLNNHVYKVISSDGVSSGASEDVYVAKHFHHYDAWRTESEVQRFLASRQLAPQVYCAKDQWLVTEYIEQPSLADACEEDIYTEQVSNAQNDSAIKSDKRKKLTLNQKIVQSTAAMAKLHQLSHKEDASSDGDGTSLTTDKVSTLDEVSALDLPAVLTDLVGQLTEIEYMGEAPSFQQSNTQFTKFAQLADVKVLIDSFKVGAQKAINVAHALAKETNPDELVLVHGDVNFANVFFPKNSASNPLLIDFEAASFAPVSYEIGMFLAINQLPLAVFELINEKYAEYNNNNKLGGSGVVTCYAFCASIVNGIWFLLQALERSEQQHNQQTIYLAKAKQQLSYFITLSNIIPNT